MGFDDGAGVEELVFPDGDADDEVVPELAEEETELSGGSTVEATGAW